MPSHPARPCVVCGRLATGGRCPAHPYRKPGPRDYPDERARRLILEQWRDQVGNICAGIPDRDHPPHPTPDLTVHHLNPRAHGGTLQDGWTVICRSLNAQLGTGHTPGDTPGG